MPKWLLCSLLAILSPCAGASPHASAKGVQVKVDEAHQRVNVTIDGKPLTAYVWPGTLKKPVLFPLIAPDGTEVTRGYPLLPHPGERVDHPHHAGMWFNYGNVNGFDFWNNSDAIQPEKRSKMGSIYQRKILSARSGPDEGELAVESVWVTGENQEILEQTTRYVFARRRDERVIDEVTTLKAIDRAVFNDDKEGLFGLRVAHFLESPTEKGGIFRDANGVATKVADSSLPGATGVYLTSEGKKGDAVWSTRGRWCTLTGHTGDHIATIAILDHPENPGYPTYWHARGYGLFAANPLGRSIFDPGAPPFNFTLEKGRSATFRYRVILFSRNVPADEMNRDADAFAGEYR